MFSKPWNGFTVVCVEQWNAFSKESFEERPWTPLHCNFCLPGSEIQERLLNAQWQVIIFRAIRTRGGSACEPFLFLSFSVWPFFPFSDSSFLASPPLFLPGKLFISLFAPSHISGLFASSSFSSSSMVLWSSCSSLAVACFCYICIVPLCIPSLRRHSFF